jgi:hypothetical protein
VTFSDAPVLLLLLFLGPIIWLGRPWRSFDRKRQIVSLALRVVLFTCLILALAGTQFRYKTDRLAVVFLLDVSDSMSNDSQTIALEYIRDALQAMGPDDQAALITFSVILSTGVCRPSKNWKLSVRYQ